MDDRESFRKAAIEYLRDDDAVTEPHVQKRIADELEQLAEELKKADELLRYFEEQAIQAFNTRPSTLSSRF